MYVLAIDPIIYVGAGTLFTGVGTFALAIIYGNITSRAADRQATVAERALEQNERIFQQTVKRDAFEMLQKTVDHLQAIIDGYEEQIKIANAALAVCEQGRQEDKAERVRDKEEISKLRERVAVLEEENKK